MKLLKILLMAFLAAAMFTPAMAEDRLTLNGTLQVRSHYYSVDQEVAHTGNIPSHESADSPIPKSESNTALVEDQGAAQPEEARAGHRRDSPAVETGRSSE